jgi:uncharacterized protein (DUF1800 family)
MKLSAIVAGVLAGVCLSAANAQSIIDCPFNVDNSTSGTGNADPLRDALVLMRYARGVSGTALVAGTGLNAATVTDTIRANIPNAETNTPGKLDVDGNGFFDVNDAAAIARVLLSFSGEGVLPPGTKAGAGASRIDARAIKTFIDYGCQAKPLQNNVPAARFLTQATFGVSNEALIAFNALPGATTKDKATEWINRQINSTPRKNKHLDYVNARYARADAINYTNPAPSQFDNFYNDVVRHSFWQQALKHPDQLRQRVAFALSQIMVVSSNGGSNDVSELANYLDILTDGAFGNFRALIQKVALSNAMGRYLNHLRNDGNSETPNENFARELLQLFTLGLTELNIDGSNKAGNPATYTEDMVKGFARVFTGFAFDDPFVTAVDGTDFYGGEHPSWWYTPNNDGETYANPNAAKRAKERAVWGKSMKAFAGRHSKAAKPLLKYNYASPVSACANAVSFASNGTATLPALVRTPPPNTYENNGTTEADAMNSVNAAIDNIFCHPNVGPFISKALIRFLVTSTPSKAYVQRVAEKFNNNGAGVRGDMAAVVRAILLDDEAMTPSTYSAPDYNYAKFGKLKEPILRLSAIVRAFDGTSSSGHYPIDYLDSVEWGINQGPLQSPSVFNFFHPEFVPPGPVAAAGAFGPEFEITTTTSIAATANTFGGMVWGSDGDEAYAKAGITYAVDCNTYHEPPNYFAKRDTCIYSDLSPLYALWLDAGAMFDYLNVILLQGQLPSSVRANYVTALNSAFPPNPLPASPEGWELEQWQRTQRERVKGAMWLLVHSPEFQIQR